MKKRFLSMLVLLAAVATGAWAQTETLLTTITATSKDSYSETTSGVVTVSHDNDDFYDSYGWAWSNQVGSITVEAKEGYTITRCVFILNDNPIATISSSPFKVNFLYDWESTFYYCEGTDPAKGLNCVTSIEVYGTAGPTTYSITLDEGTGNKDSQNWEITPKSSELDGGEAVTVKYNGSREVKSVTVVKKVEKAVDNTYQTWDAGQKKLVEAKIPAEVTTVANADAGVTWSAGTYVVEGQVKINGTIELSGDVNLIIKDDAKLTANKIIGVVGDGNNLSIYGQAQMTGELVINGSSGGAFYNLSTLEVHSAKVTATSSYSGGGGFNNIVTFNVYGGLVDAKGENGYGICMRKDDSMNIYGGEVKAEGQGNGALGSGILCTNYSEKAKVTVYGGKLWVGSVNNIALYMITLTIDKSLGFNGEIETSSDNFTWNPTVGTPDTKYVRVGY